MLTADEVSKMEPEVHSLGALYCPTSGIIDSYKYMEYLETDVLKSGGDIVYKTKVTNIKKKDDGYKIYTQDENGVTSSVSSKYVINCAGHGACDVANVAGMETRLSGYKLAPTKGMYVRVNKQLERYPKTLIYPFPPLTSGLGAHTCPDVYGGMRLGPLDKNLLDVEPVEKWDYNVPEDIVPVIGDQIRKMLPFVKDEDLSPGDVHIPY